ncbi:MAG: 8-oxoguanine deaminase [Shackletoniella antarctica]|uniref:8-oxoguanine deaminase n=1 Tax=Shackletoniella antarctica TaxID=268115 RepID=A0A2W4W5G5_9CYAN|nr:MAG: 8-oxoguanine deaminase [Shackletoniella antarctica]
MPTLLVKNIHTLITMDDRRREIRSGALFICDHVIGQVGTTEELPQTADRVLDLGDRHLVLPGLVNTHHHFFQTLTRVVPGAQNSALFDWLSALYPLWQKLTSEAIALSAQVAAAELIYSGCTTASDHLYLFPNGCTLDDEIEAVRQTGLRFHASRGSMSVGESKGGLPPDSIVEAEADILKDSQRLIEQYHDNDPYALVRITLAPCSPFSVSTDLMRESAALARSYPGVRLHTHLAENNSDVTYSLDTFGLTPGDYAASVGWLGDDVWHAHCVKLDDKAIHSFGQTGTGVAHCPCSNMRLASGMAPIRKLLDHNVPVGLGVDGSASNDGSHLLAEARQAFLMARVREENPAALTAREALELATRGGARVLGRTDIGHLAPGMAADFVAVNLDRLALSGTAYDPVAALIFCMIDRVDYSFIHGREVLKPEGLLTLDLPMVLEKHGAIARSLAA